MSSIKPTSAEWECESLGNLPLKRVSDRMINTYHFLEQLNFTREAPHTVRWKTFPENEIVPLHYASSVEIILASNLEGEVTIGQSVYQLRSQDVIYIPPWVVHSTNVRKCKGMLIGIKISNEALSEFLNIPALLNYTGLSLYDIASVHDCYAEAYEIVCRLIEDDDNIMLRMRDIVELIALIAKKSTSNRCITDLKHKNDILHRLISWTNEHYMGKITIEDAAKQLHFSKCYFCRYFKSFARISYLTYLNQVRISHATIMLRQGNSVIDCAHACGFSSVSYFITLFKKIIGRTPGEYIKSLSDVQ